MSSPFRTAFAKARPLRCLVATTRARRAYANIPTKNPNPTPPKDDSKEQAMPVGRFYEAVLNTPQPVPEVKPEDPATTVKETTKAAASKGEPESAATATAGTAPTASSAASPQETAKEAADKASSLASSTSGSPPPSVRQHFLYPASTFHVADLCVLVEGDVTTCSHATPDRTQRRRQGKDCIRDTPRRSDRARRAAGADPVEKQRHRGSGRATQARGARQLLHERVCELRVGPFP